MQPETPKFRRWLAAEKEAHLAERELDEAELQFASNLGAAPSAQAVLAVRAKRARAHALFDEAMQELKSLVESLHSGSPYSVGAPAETTFKLQDADFRKHTPPPAAQASQ